MSVGDGMNQMESKEAGADTSANTLLNTSTGGGGEFTDIEGAGRRALYGTLPFFSTFGMSSREMTLRDVISKASTNAKNVITAVGNKKDGSLQKRLDNSGNHTANNSRNNSNNYNSITNGAEAVDGDDNDNEDYNVDEIVMTTPLSMAVLVAIISQFLVGYNTGVMNTPAAYVFPNHTVAEWSLSVAAFAIGGPGGAVLGGWLANRLGRRRAILIDSWLFFVGGLFMTLAPNVWCLIPARLLIGFAAGLSSVVVPVYLGEMAPPTLRGTLGTFTQFAIVIGILVSGLLGLLWASATQWRYLFAVTPVCCVIQVR
jgi:hypothetical protein